MKEIIMTFRELIEILELDKNKLKGKNPRKGRDPLVCTLRKRIKPLKWKP